MIAMKIQAAGVVPLVIMHYLRAPRILVEPGMRCVPATAITMMRGSKSAARMIQAQLTAMPQHQRKLIPLDSVRVAGLNSCHGAREIAVMTMLGSGSAALLRGAITVQLCLARMKLIVARQQLSLLVPVAGNILCLHGRKEILMVMTPGTSSVVRRLALLRRRHRRRFADNMAAKAVKTLATVPEIAAVRGLLILAVLAVFKEIWAAMDIVLAGQ